MEACRPPRIVKLFEKFTRTSHAARALEKLWHSEELGLGTALFFDPSDGFVTARDTPLTRQSHRLASCGRLRIPPQEERTYIASCRGVRIPPQEEGDLINHRVWAFTTWWRRTPQHQSLSLSYLSLSLFLSFFPCKYLDSQREPGGQSHWSAAKFFFFRKKRNIFGSQQEERNVAFPTVKILHILARKKA